MKSDGFSLVEIVVATALVLLVVAAVFALLDPVRGGSPVPLEASDMQQRLRVAADELTKDLSMAGGGAYAGADGGALTSWTAAVFPYRVGAVGADPPGSYRQDAITLIYVAATAAQGSLSAPVSASQLTLQVSAGPGCPLAQDLCGFAAGTTVLITDNSGRFDTFLLTSVAGSSGQLAVNRPGGVLHAAYAAGSRAVQVVQRTYAVRTGPQNIPQLVSYDGSTSADVPIVDHVVGLAFEYYGDPQPPMAARPVAEPSGPWTTYGPKPPAPDARPTAYPAGENCAFTLNRVSGVEAPRLAVLGTPSASTGLVRLTAGELADGNAWCPDGDAPDRFDADLLRIRKIGVTLRVESAVDALRGPAGVLFTRPGSATNARRFLPDYEVHFQVTPWNLNLRP